jgi:glycerol-3-phosphate cytidylyltransferase-like family protein
MRATQMTHDRFEKLRDNTLMTEDERREALEHLEYIRTAVSEISSDVKAINAQLAAMQRLFPLSFERKRQ